MDERSTCGFTYRGIKKGRKFYDTVNNELLKFTVIISQSNGKWVFCEHKERGTYEVLEKWTYSLIQPKLIEKLDKDYRKRVGYGSQKQSLYKDFSVLESESWFEISISV